MRIDARSARRLVRGAAMFVLAAGACFPAAADVTHNQKAVWAADVFGGYSSSTVSVKFVQGFALPGGGAASVGVPALDQLLSRWGVLKVEPAYPMPFGNPEMAAQVGLDRDYIIDVPEGTDTPTMVKQLLGFPQVFEAVTPVGIGGTAEIPNDPKFDQCYGENNTGQYIAGNWQPQYGIADADVDAPEAWDIFSGDDNVVVGLIDSGVNVNHEDLLGQCLQGWNTVTNNTEISDGCPHGTHPAGTIAAITNNNKGVAGMCRTAKILPVKVLTGCGGNTTDCAEGIIWAADHGANVESMSLQYYQYDQFHHDSVQYAHGLGVLVIAAAGNQQGEIVAYPAKYENCMAVTATDNRDQFASFSNFGAEVDVSAPGQDVYSSWVDGGYQFDSGTSMATPHVSGAAALIRSYNPALSPDEVQEVIKASTDDLGAPRWDKYYGTGRLNLYNALLISTPGVYIKVPVVPATLQAAGAVVSFDVTIKKGNDELVANSELLHYRFDGGAYQTLPLVYQQGDTWNATLPAVQCGDAPEFYVSAEGVNTGVVTYPKKAPDEVMAFDVGELHTDYVSVAGFNNGLPQGWSADGLWHVSGACSVGDSCDGGTFAYYGKDAGCTYKTKGQANSGALSTGLVVPDAPAPPYGKVELVYCSNLQTEGNGAYDAATVFFNDVQLTQDKNSESWLTQTLDVTAYAGQTVTLKFNFDTKDGYNNDFRGWQVDGVQFAVTGVVCAGGCYADYNGDGALDIFDFLAFLNGFNAGDQKADCDGNGVFDLFDFLCFVNKFNAGC